MNITGFFSWVFVTLVTLLPIINPVNTAFLLLGISSHLTEEERNRQIILACIYMTGILVVFLLAGHFIMLIFGISIPGIRIAGGMVIGLLGFRMLFPSEDRIIQKGKQEAFQKQKISTLLSARIKKYWGILGPGLITGASDVDPSGIATYSQAGAGFGFATLWTAIITFPLMAAVQEMCARIGMVTQEGLTGTLKKKYPKSILYLRR